MAQAENNPRTKAAPTAPAYPQETTLWERNAFRAALLLIGAVAAFVVYIAYTAYQREAWQLYAALGVNVAYLVLAAGCIYLIRRGRSSLAMQLLIGGMSLVTFLDACFIADIGLVVGVSAAIVAWTIAAQALPPRLHNRIMLLAFVAGTITAGVGSLALPFQLSIPGLQTFTPGLAVAVIVVYGGIIAWQFKSYTLRVKLIAVFLLVSIFSAGAVAFFSNRATSDDLTASVGNNLQNVARTQALAVGELLARQVDTLHTLGLNKNLQDAVVVQNAGYTGSAAEIRAVLNEMDRQWQQAEAGRSALIESRINPKFNTAAADLLEFSQDFPEQIEVLVADRYGGLVAATNHASGYYHADEPWWQRAYNDGYGGVYISQPEYDASNRVLVFNIAVPVYSHNSQQVIGVIRMNYPLQPLANLLARARFGQTGQATLLLAGDHPIAISGRDLTLLDPRTIQAMRVIERKAYGVVDFNGVDNLVSQAPVNTADANTAIDNLGWTMVAQQQRQEALAPVEDQTRSLMFLALLIVGLSAGVAVVVAQLLAGPIIRLTAVAQQVTGGNLDARARVESGDETGALAATFNVMTNQLRDIIDTLEERVAERTQQLQTVVKVSQRLAGILDLSDLLRQVVTTTKETFNYYHVHIYLMDESRQSLSMAEGYGEAGAEMRRLGHVIPLTAPRSLVARAAREGQIITVENVREDAGWLPNPLLPETRSEMAVPIILGREIVGVLDVQSEREGGLTQEDEATLQILANQVAVAVRNARLFSETQEALYQAQKLQRLYTGQAWQKLAAARRTRSYEFRQPGLSPLPENDPPEAVAAIQQGQTVDLPCTIALPATNGKAQAGPGEPAADSEAASTALATPLRLRGQVIGVLGIQTDNPERRWSSEEIALIEAVGEQMSLAIENARLFEETSRRAGREKVIADVTRRVWASGDLEHVMRTAVEQLGATLDASKVVIRLGTEEELLASSPDEPNGPA